MIQKDNIELFVRQTLGCACPDEVFERIDCRTDVDLPGGIALDYSLSIISLCLKGVSEEWHCRRQALTCLRFTFVRASLVVDRVGVA